MAQANELVSTDKPKRKAKHNDHDMTNIVKEVTVQWQITSDRGLRYRY